MPALRMPLRTEPDLAERVRLAHEEIESFIDGKVAALKAECVGIPTEVLRRDLTRGDSCLCRIYMTMKD